MLLRISEYDIYLPSVFPELNEIIQVKIFSAWHKQILNTSQVFCGSRRRGEGTTGQGDGELGV